MKVINLTNERYSLPELGVICTMDSLETNLATACYPYSQVTVSKGQNSGIKMGDHEKLNFKHRDCNVCWKGSITSRVRGFTL